MRKWRSANSLANGHCDPRCNVSACNFDGGDCAPKASWFAMVVAEEESHAALRKRGGDGDDAAAAARMPGRLMMLLGVLAGGAVVVLVVGGWLWWRFKVAEAEGAEERVAFCSSSNGAEASA